MTGRGVNKQYGNEQAEQGISQNAYLGVICGLLQESAKQMPLDRQPMLSAEGLKSLGFWCAQASAGNSIRAGNVEKTPLPVGSLIQGGLTPLGALSGGGRTLIPNRGEEIRSLRHVGHRPGRVNRARSRKIKPQ